ncbi:MAG: GTP cyclohydrolase II, partial [Gammaproteobacteria bacterium]
IDADGAPPPKRETNPMDWRQVGLGAQILADVGVQKMRVMSNPRKYHAISGFGLEVVEYVT